VSDESVAEDKVWLVVVAIDRTPTSTQGKEYNHA